MSRRFFDALSRFMERLTFMSGMAGQPREGWMPARENDFAAVRKCWVQVQSLFPGAPEDIARFKELVDACLSCYEKDENDAGDWAFRAADEFQQNLRDKTYAETRGRSSNDPKA